jgi:hypothetical protein
VENVLHTRLSLMLCKNDLESLAVSLHVIFYTSGWRKSMLHMKLWFADIVGIVRMKCFICSAMNYLV